MQVLPRYGQKRCFGAEGNVENGASNLSHVVQQLTVYTYIHMYIYMYTPTLLGLGTPGSLVPGSPGIRYSRSDTGPHHNELL